MIKCQLCGKSKIHPRHILMTLFDKLSLFFGWLAWSLDKEA